MCSVIWGILGCITVTFTVKILFSQKYEPKRNGGEKSTRCRKVGKEMLNFQKINAAKYCAPHQLPQPSQMPVCHLPSVSWKPFRGTQMLLVPCQPGARKENSSHLCWVPHSWQKGAQTPQANWVKRVVGTCLLLILNITLTKQIFRMISDCAAFPSSFC